MRNIPRRLLVIAGVFSFLIVTVVCVRAQNAKPSADPSFLTSLEADVITEINLARANPKKYAAYLEDCRKYYNGKDYSPPSTTKPIKTFDGIAGVEEAILFLQSKEPQGPLQPSLGLSFGARDHAQDMAVKGTSGHRGSDGSLPNDRISRYGTWKTTVGEAILYRVGTAREMVVDLIIEDGNPDRPHRKNVFDSSFQLAGVSISPDSTQGRFCVIDYAGVFAEKAGLKAQLMAGGKTTAPAQTSENVSATSANKTTTRTPAATRNSKGKTTKRG